MRKKLIIASIVVTLLTSVLLFSASKKEAMWRKAITEKDTRLRFEYLKEYEVLYGKKKDKVARYLYLNLANAAYKLQNFDETIQYGEQALTFAETDETNRLNVYFMLSNSFKVTKKEMDKAHYYAQQTIELANELISKRIELSQNADATKKDSAEKFINNYKTFFLAPALRIQSQLLYAKGKDDPALLKEATLKACEAFKIDKSTRSSNLVFTLAYRLFTKKKTADAIEALETILDKEKPVHKVSYLLANGYIRKNDKAKAAEYFEMAYQSSKKATLAKKIGKLVHKNNIDKGIKYFAEAFVLMDSNKQSDAYKYLENLYFNKPDVKSKSPADQEKGFRAIINAARVRLGKEPVAAPLPDTEKTTESQTETTG